jgi:rare lipoprotein A (peptidoglycan hydrolase)
LQKITAQSVRTLSIILILSLVGCASIPTARYHSHQFKPYNSTGMASFYGYHDGFDGRRMANGERFDANNPHLAAHPSLP